MNESFRRRVFVPLIMPLTVLGAVLLFAVALARVMLAVPSTVAVLVAVGVAGYVLMMAFLVEKNRSITAPAITVALSVGFIGVLGAGGVAASVGIRDIHHHDEGEELAEGEGPVEIPADALVWGSNSGLAYTSSPEGGTAGEVTLALTNDSGLEHNVVFEGFMGDAELVSAVDGADVATVEVPAGTYTYYCSIPGHRAGGMEGEITFS
jgi:plastocyanin